MLDWLQKIVKLNVCPSVSDYMKMYSLTFKNASQHVISLRLSAGCFMNDDERTLVMNTGDDEILKYGGWIGYCKGHKNMLELDKESQR